MKHADFSSEVERVIKAVDTAILIVNSSEGPMPHIKLSLKDIEPEICRRIQVPKEYTFWDLHVDIQDVMVGMINICMSSG